MDIRPFTRPRVHPASSRIGLPNARLECPAQPADPKLADLVASSQNVAEGGITVASAPLTASAGTDRFQIPRPGGTFWGVRIVREEPANANDQSTYPQAAPGAALQDQHSRGGGLSAEARRVPACKNGHPQEAELGPAEGGPRTVVQWQGSDRVHSWRRPQLAGTLDRARPRRPRPRASPYPL